MREVFEYTQFWAAGTGREFALGAMHALYARLQTAEAVARAGRRSRRDVRQELGAADDALHGQGRRRRDSRGTALPLVTDDASPASCSSTRRCAARWCRSADTVRAVLACHPYPPALRACWASCSPPCALLASTLKFNGSLIVQLRATVRCGCWSSNARTRSACARWRNGTRSAPTALGRRRDARRPRGRSRARPPRADARPERARARSTRASSRSKSGSVAGLIEHYLATSEQLASRILLCVATARRPGSSCSACPAPATPTTPPGRACASASTRSRPPRCSRARARTTHRSARVPGGRRARVQPRAGAASPARARASASTNALRIAGAAEVESILAERGDVEVTCEFCNRRYTFAPDEARAVFAPADSTRH